MTWTAFAILAMFLIYFLHFECSGRREYLGDVGGGGREQIWDKHKLSARRVSNSIFKIGCSNLTFTLIIDCFSRYGIMVNNDAVVRTSYYKYFHPKVMIMMIVIMLVFADNVT